MSASTSSRLRIGVDVPWVTSWSDEPVAGLTRCSHARGAWALRQMERPGSGRPQYASNHFGRQRASVARMLCPMCGRPTRAGDRWLLTGRVETAGELRARGLGDGLPPQVADGRRVVNAGTVAPGHRACLTEAARRCPHLQARPETALVAFPDRWLVWPLWVEAQDWTPADSGRRPPPAVAFLQLCGLAG